LNADDADNADLYGFFTHILKMMQKYDFQLDIYYHSIIFVHIAKSSKERHCEERSNPFAFILLGLLRSSQ